MRQHVLIPPLFCIWAATLAPMKVDRSAVQCALNIQRRAGISAFTARATENVPSLAKSLMRFDALVSARPWLAVY